MPAHLNSSHVKSSGGTSTEQVTQDSPEEGELLFFFKSHWKYAQNKKLLNMWENDPP